jgi:hypothetical protein
MKESGCEVCEADNGKDALKDVMKQITKDILRYKLELVGILPVAST